MKRRVEYEGKFHTIECLELADGSCPVGEFLDGLNSGDRRKLDVLFELLCDHPNFRNKEKFKKLTGSDGIWEFKSYQIRLLCFFAPGQLVLLANAIIKKTRKLKKADIKVAEQRHRWYLSQKEENL